MGRHCSQTGIIILQKKQKQNNNKNPIKDYKIVLNVYINEHTIDMIIDPATTPRQASPSVTF